MNGRPPTSHLNTADCWILLEAQKVGRLALTDDAGAPDIFPVNYVAYQGAVYFRSAPDIKDVRLASQPAAAFEIDGHDEAGWWSVVLRGVAARVEDAVEMERSGIHRVATASPRRKTHVLKLTASVITGRRFHDRGDAGPATVGIELPATDAAEEPSRGAPPHSIPSHPPLA